MPGSPDQALPGFVASDTTRARSAEVNAASGAAGGGRRAVK